jgi:hypothetical protein
MKKRLEDIDARDRERELKWERERTGEARVDVAPQSERGVVEIEDEGQAAAKLKDSLTEQVRDSVHHWVEALLSEKIQVALDLVEGGKGGEEEDACGEQMQGEVLCSLRG